MADGEDWVSLGNWGIQETIQGDTLQGVRYSIQGRLADRWGCARPKCGEHGCSITLPGSRMVCGARVWRKKKPPFPVSGPCR